MSAAQSVSETRRESPQYDYARRRRATRTGRQKGCYIYVPADELVKAGIDPDGPPPEYRLWGTRGGGLMGRLYAPENPS